MNENDVEFENDAEPRSERIPRIEPEPAEDYRRRPDYKNPILAGLLSGFPGLGNLYNGLYLRGVTFFLIVLSLIRLTDEHGLFGFALAFFWLFNMIDAYRQATLINWGVAQDLGLKDAPARPAGAQAGLAAGFILFAIGLIALLERYVAIDIDWVFELWPVALMLIGAWIVVGALRERAHQRDDDTETDF